MGSVKLSAITTNMKTVLALSFLVCLVYLTLHPTQVSAETCNPNKNCTVTKCDDFNEVICHHPEGGFFDGVCTCSVKGYPCSATDDCKHVQTLTSICAGIIHCFDNKCICGCQ